MKHHAINEYLILPYRFAVLIIFYAIERVSFYLFNTELFPNCSLSDWPLMMYGGLRFDISALIYLNLLWFVCYILSFKAKFKKRYSSFLEGLFFTLNAIGLAMNCIDFIYYRFILKRTTYNVLDILAGEENMTTLWGQFFVDYWYVFLYFIVLLTLFVYAIRLYKPKVTPVRNSIAYAIIGILVFGIVAALSVAGIRGGVRHSTRPITLSNAAAYTSSPEESAIVLNTPFSFIRTIGKKGFEHLSYFSEDEIDNYFSPIHKEKAISTEPNRKNVVIFILESFSREFIGAMNPTLEDGKYAGYTPFLDSLVSQSLSFCNAYSNGRKSIDAMPSILASIPSLTMPYVVSQYSNNKVNSIASILNDEGYETAFFHGAPNGSMGFDAFAKIAGFKSYRGKNEYNNDNDFDGIWGIWDDKFFQYYANEISSMQEPFCAALFSLSSHHPFKVPAEFEGRFPKGKLPVEECIGYTDYALRQFFNNVKDKPWFNNTLFVITADHSSIPDHSEYMNNAQAFAVPILFYSPNDSTLTGSRNVIAQQADIMPSILSYLGISKKFVSFGIDLFSTPDNEHFAVNFNNGVYQLYKNDSIAYFDGKVIAGLYDMKRDPMLTTDIKEENPNTTKSFEQIIKAYLQQYNNRMIEDRLTIIK
ncbi:MAG: sulfatase-like hydrolase/transferase [Marinilabiliaceae bacterium]|nr:sulfatase-like hydrolase/transferase [Marinilabiliaceae bacterium]